MRAMMAYAARRSAGMAWAAAAELTWHLAGPAWAFGLLAAAVAWIAAQLPAMAASAKSYSTQARVDALVPAVAQANTTAGNAQTAVTNLANGNSGTGQPAGQPTGPANNGGVTSGVQMAPYGQSTDTADVGQTSDQVGGAASHYHYFGGHRHNMGHIHSMAHGHDFMGHYHPLS